MRENFKAWLRPTKREFAELWDTCIITFDTNVLLNLYRYSEQSRDDLLTMVGQISHRAWLPHQVALEFYKGRAGVVAEIRRSYSALLKDFDKQQKDVVASLDQLHRHSRIDREALTERINAAFASFREPVEAHLARIARSGFRGRGGWPAGSPRMVAAAGVGS